MNRNHGLRMAPSIALALGLTACGGGGGGGIASIPPAPVTPTPTVTPASFTMTAPARALTAPGAPVIASTAGPNFTTEHTGTPFPVLQTTMMYDGASARPDPIVYAAHGSDRDGIFMEANVVFDWENPPMSTGYGNLDWTRVGSWSTGGTWWDYDDTVGRTGVFVGGYETSTASMPTIGAAIYNGVAEGTVFHQGGTSDSTHCRCDVVALTGNASFTANFGTRNVSGSLTGMTAGGTPWNSVAFNSTITGNAFSGTSSVTSNPGNMWSLAGNATGTVEGKFFGPTAQEAGAVWTLFDGTNAAIGTLAGKRP
jgi:hypothetical protein